MSRRCPVRRKACWRRGSGWSHLASVRDAAQAALDAMSKLSPETVEVEFGIKLAPGEAGALIAKASAEGQFTVRLSWSPGSKPPDKKES